MDLCRPPFVGGLCDHLQLVGIQHSSSKLAHHGQRYVSLSNSKTNRLHFGQVMRSLRVSPGAMIMLPRGSLMFLDHCRYGLPGFIFLFLLPLLTQCFEPLHETRPMVHLGSRLEGTTRFIAFGADGLFVVHTSSIPYSTPMSTSWNVEGWCFIVGNLSRYFGLVPFPFQEPTSLPPTLHDNRSGSR